MDEQRKPILIGIDLRPVPLEMSDGQIWYFNPDPAKDFFQRLSGIGKDLQKESELDWDMIDQIRQSLAKELTQDADAFLSKNYGLAVLSALAAAYAETVVAIPTGQSSPSGPGRKGTGGSK